MDTCFSAKRSPEFFLEAELQDTRNPPALAAAVFGPGRQIRIDVNDLHSSLGQAHDTVLRETARQMGITVTGRLGYCDGYAGGKEIRKAVAKSMSCRAKKRMQRLYADLAGPMPTSIGGARYV